MRLIPAQFVKSYENDFLDAEAIAEAVDCHNMCKGCEFAEWLGLDF